MKDSDKKRLFEYDMVRVVAMLFVISVHALIVIDFSSSISLLYFQIVQAIFFTCNGMFFMLSGKFALTAKGDYARYYWGKFHSIVIPMLIYFLIRTVFEYPNTLCLDNLMIKTYLSNLSGGFSSTEYWFLFTLVGNLVLAPLLAKAFTAWGKLEHTLFICFGIAYHGLLTVLGIFNFPFSYSFLFSGWSFYFYLGYSADKLFETRRSHTLLTIGGFLCLTVIVLLKYMGIVLYIHDLSPLFTVVTLAAFFAIRELGEQIKKSKSLSFLVSLISFLSKYTFSVYLVHMMVLNTILKYYLLNGGQSILHHWMILITTFIGSFLVAFVIDNIVVRTIQNISDKGVYMLRRKRIMATSKSQAGGKRDV